MKPLVGIIMGSSSDWETMQSAAEMLDKPYVPHEVRVVSAHRTPDLLFEYASGAARSRLEVIIAGAGGAAHLPVLREVVGAHPLGAVDGAHLRAAGVGGGRVGLPPARRRAAGRAAPACRPRGSAAGSSRSACDTTVPVGRWVMRTAESVVLTLCPPGPDER